MFEAYSPPERDEGTYLYAHLQRQHTCSAFFGRFCIGQTLVRIHHEARGDVWSNWLMRERERVSRRNKSEALIAEIELPRSPGGTSTRTGTFGGSAVDTCGPSY